MYFARVVVAVAVLAGGASALVRSPVSMAAIGKGSGVTVLGPGNKQVQLIAAKLATKAGYKATVVLDGEDQLNNARSLCYGRLYARNGADEKDKVQFAVGGEAIGAALGSSEGLIVVAAGSAPSPVLIERALAAGKGKIKRVSLMSVHGTKLSDAEAKLKAAAEANGAEWSVVRVGLLRGGGPGKVERGDDFGLSQYFYDTNPELNSFQKDKFSDRYLLGASLTKGDGVEMNVFKYALAQNAFSVITEGNTNRIAAANCLLQSLVQPSCANQDFGVTAVRGLDLPTQNQWDAAFNECFSAGASLCQVLEAPFDPNAVPEEEEEELYAAGKTDEEMAAAPAGKSFKLGASNRAEETLRKQQIGHLIPALITVAAFSQGINVVALLQNN